MTCEPTIKSKFNLILLTLVALFVSGITLAETPDITIKNDNNIYAGANHFAHLSDSEISDPITALSKSEWTEISTNNIELNFWDEPQWFHGRIHNQSGTEKDLIFSLHNPRILEIDFYLIQNGEIIQSYQMGNLRKFSNKPIPHHDIIIPLEIQSSETVDLVFRIDNYGDQTLLTPRLWENNAFFVANQSEITFYSLYTGIVLIMVAYNLVLFLFTRSISYLWYIGFVTGFAAFINIRWGRAYQYLWPETPEINQYMLLIPVCVTVAFFVLFTYNFLDLSRLHKGIKFLATFLVAILIANIISLPFIPMAQAAINTTYLALIVITLCISSAVWRACYRERSAIWYIAAWSMLFIICMIGVFEILNILEGDFFSSYGFPIGHAVEITLFSLALADKINSLKKENLVAQTQAKAKSDFLAAMSHEIRTPMNGVLGMTELLDGTELNKQQMHYTQVIKSSGKSLINIINDILDFSKIEAGKMQLEQVSFKLEPLISEALSLFTQQAATRSTELIFDIGDGVKADYIGDPTRLRQIIINLVGNAIKFTEDGEVFVRVENHGDGLKFSIKDTGIGISEEGQRKLFQAFSQVEDSTSRRFGGTGLGLTICKNLANLMAGEIGVESEEGKGSTFWFTALLQPADHSSQRTAHVDALQEKSVLIVDDNNTFCDVATHMCKALGLNPCAVTSGQEALELIESTEQNFDLVLCSLLLPGMNAPSLAEKLDKTRLKGIPKILITGMSDMVNRTKAQEMGFKSVLPKPIDIDRLKQSLLSALEIASDDSVNDKKTKSSALKKATILVAEDNATNQLVIKGMLKRLQQEITLVKDGQEAVDKILQGDQYDLILMDCEMPHLNGWEATEAIRASGSHVPIIALTAHAVPEYIDRCYESGMNGYLAKPLVIEDLESALINSLGQASQDSREAS